jgi:tRNA1(Val) A37 N6-methylase TrmN6
VVVAHVALGLTRNLDSKPVSTYVDMGCGIGSTLFLVAHSLPHSTKVIGIEAQTESFNLASKTSEGILPSRPIQILNQDLRVYLDDQRPLDACSSSLISTCDLVTANPPYAQLKTGSRPKVKRDKVYAYKN